MERIRLLLIDDHVVFREGLSRLLASEPDLDMVADCGTTREALEILARDRVDLVLLDFDLGEDRGSQFIGALRRAGHAQKILMVTAGMTAAESSAALRLGASGIFLKHNAARTLAQAIRLIADGTIWVDQRVIQLLAEHVEERGDERDPILTAREDQVLQGVFEGLSTKEIAARVNVSESALPHFLTSSLPHFLTSSLPHFTSGPCISRAPRGPADCAYGRRSS
jgi:DNA-binding NarL/FixJ family response regulator